MKQFKIRTMNGVFACGTLWIDERTKLSPNECIELTEKEAKAFGKMLEEVESDDPSALLIERGNQAPASSPITSGHAANSKAIQEKIDADAKAKDDEIAELKAQLEEATAPDA